MSLTDAIVSFLNNPIPLWEVDLTRQLVQHKWNDLLAEKRISHIQDYSTAKIWRSTGLRSDIPGSGICKNSNLSIITLEEPDFETLSEFYNEHGLDPITAAEVSTEGVAKRLEKAIDQLGMVPSVKECISLLVKKIQVLRSEDAEIDVSYSHPDIPFSIFVSVCPDNSLLSRLRVAESILHEAMHLKLTLIEEIVPLVKKASNATFYSPWRDEQRPIRGVLHGLFVFKAIQLFFQILSMQQFPDIIYDALNFRISQIDDEIVQIQEFYQCPDLTSNGASLAANLL